MITQKPRILIRQDGRNLAFCHLKFRKALSTYVTGPNSAGRKLTKTELRQDLAEHLCLSEESINNYAKGYNGPANIEVVQKMAAYHKNMLDIPDSVYNDLEELINELQYWIYGLPIDEYYCDPDEEVGHEIKFRCFGKMYYFPIDDELKNDYSEWTECVTSMVLKDYYREIRRIFKNYIPRGMS